jgi:hypothetical protein
MSEKKSEQNIDASLDDGQSGLRKALIVLAIIEALVLIPLVLYRIFR